ncbi:MAG: hypothetical protein IKN43_12290 [Selenomonadaceae bacterium]|nr:hypothetical protein [Selenomonadaceae bacterium]
MHTTANGVSESMIIRGNEVKDFDPAPVLRKRERYFSPFDYYRIELVTEEMYRPWGYKPQYYTDGKKYTKDEIRELFKKPFKCEEFNFVREQQLGAAKERENMYKALEERLSRPANITEDGEELVPIPWLKPKKEFMTGKLYE